MSGYRTVSGSASAELEVKRSRFLGEVCRVDDEAAARKFIASVRERHRDARHHCTAFVIGPDAMLQRTNDDGEPSGTAGAPILEVLTGRGLSDTVVVVTRWFGGTLLGAGGLVRAYGETAGLALDAAGVQPRTLRHVMSVVADAGEAGWLGHRLRALGTVVAETYGADVEFEVAVQDAETFRAEVASATGGRARVEQRGTSWVDD